MAIIFETQKYFSESLDKKTRHINCHYAYERAGEGGRKGKGERREKEEREGEGESVLLFKSPHDLTVIYTSRCY